MKSNTSLVASQVRLQEWALMVKECNNRPQGMKIDLWCQQHNITKANYYYRLRKVRKACLDLMDASEVPSNSFVELQVPSESIDNTNRLPVSNAGSSVAAVLTLPNGFRIELLSNASVDFMKSIFEACTYVK